MTCPFAKFASILPLAPAKHATSFHAVHRFHPPPSPSSPSSSTVALTLSEALRIGTAHSHRAVEKSRGVSLLLQSVTHPTSSASATTTLDEQEVLDFGRLDYVRFNIMLACVYIALESSMYVARQSELLAPLFGDVGLVGLLARSGVLVEDVRVHLETIEAHTGAELVEFVQVAREEHGYFSQGATVEEDVEDSSARRELFRLVQECLPSAAQLTPKWKSAGLTEEHIDLLRPAQVRSTLAYVSRLTTLAHSTSSNLLLAHAYTRYLGDLSGGQHIVKKVSKRFPCTNNAQGFAFYTFDTSTDLLKTRFRNAMEQSSSSSDSTLVDALVQEANTAFDLNTGLFESLLPATLRMNKEEVEKVDGVQAGKVQQAVVDMWTADKVVSVAGAVVFAVTTAVWVRHLLTGSAGVVGVHA